MVRSMLSESIQAVIAQTLIKRVGGGRIAAHEIMLGTSAIRNLIRENKVAQMYSMIQTGQSEGMQTLDQCLQTLVRDRLADILEIEPGQINEGDSFADDLEADSLALIELVEAIEEEVSDRADSFRIEDEDLQDLRLVRDAVDYVYSRVGDGS